MEDGGPAFPDLDAMNGNGSGMSLLDYFAAHALSGLLAFSPEGCESTGQYKFHEAAERAYSYADAMLAERERRAAAKPK